jgi:hypothetical protein
MPPRCIFFSIFLFGQAYSQPLGACVCVTTDCVLPPENSLRRRRQSLTIARVYGRSLYRAEEGRTPLLLLISL